MNFLNQIKARLVALFRKRELDAEMDEEMRSHIEMRTQANIAAGNRPIPTLKRGPVLWMRISPSAIGRKNPPSASGYSSVPV